MSILYFAVRAQLRSGGAAAGLSRTARAPCSTHSTRAGTPLKAPSAKPGAGASEASCGTARPGASAASRRASIPSSDARSRAAQASGTSCAATRISDPSARCTRNSRPPPSSGPTACASAAASGLQNPTRSPGCTRRPAASASASAPTSSRIRAVTGRISALRPRSSARRPFAASAALIASDMSCLRISAARPQRRHTRRRR